MEILIMIIGGILGAACGAKTALDVKNDADEVVNKLKKKKESEVETKEE